MMAGATTNNMSAWLGVLNNVVSLPSECSTHFSRGDSQVSIFWGAFYPTPIYCYPPKLQTSGAGAASQYYSPGVCPISWGPADLSSTGLSTWAVETTVLCCPRFVFFPLSYWTSFTMLNANTHRCIVAITSSQVLIRCSAGVRS